MHILVVGLNYKTASVEVREKLALAEEQLPQALKKLKTTTSILECAIIATCNRTEIYVVVDRAQICGHYVRTFIEEWFQLPRERFTSNLYMYEDANAIKHLFRVASGLDSMIIGETQILGQVRDAFLTAQKEGATGTVFNKLFKEAITLAKRAHTETKIGELAVSVSYAAVELGKHIFGQFEDKSVMIFGAGETSELTAKHLNANGAKQMMVANRSIDKAKELATKFNGQACTLDEAKNRLLHSDIVISSTASPQYVLTAQDVQAVMEKRRHRPLFMIDIAVPRDFDPKITEIDNVFLYDIDDLQHIVEANLSMRKQEALKIEVLIQKAMDEFNQWYKTLGVVPVIRSLQNKAADIHEQTIQSMFNKLPNLSDQEQKIIRKLTKSMVNQMIQDPILQIKEIAGQRKADDVMDTFIQLFQLQEQLKQLELIEKQQEDNQSSAKHSVNEQTALVRSAHKVVALVRG